MNVYVIGISQPNFKLFCRMYSLIVNFKVEADKLKTVTAGGTAMKIVALGIGKGIDPVELRNIATEPHDKNVIDVEDFSKLSEVEEQLRNVSCVGQ